MAGREPISKDQADSKPVLSRRTSLPVMKGSSIDLSRLAGMGQVGEEDEGEKFSKKWQDGNVANGTAGSADDTLERVDGRAERRL